MWYQSTPNMQKIDTLLKMRNLSIIVERLETTLHSDFKEILLIMLQKNTTQQDLEYILRHHLQNALFQWFSTCWVQTTPWAARLFHCP